MNQPSFGYGDFSGYDYGVPSYGTSTKNNYGSYGGSTGYTLPTT